MADEPNCKENQTDPYANVKVYRQMYPRNLIVSHLNVNSLRLKINKISVLLFNSRFKVLVLSETKLDSSHSNSLYKMNGYTMYRQDKRSNSGGLIAYVSKNIPSTIGSINICNEDLECMSVELNCNGTKISLLCMYKNPKMSSKCFKQSFEETCEKILDEHENVIIIGDLNFNMLKKKHIISTLPHVKPYKHYNRTYMLQI